MTEHENPEPLDHPINTAEAETEALPQDEIEIPTPVEVHADELSVEKEESKSRKLIRTSVRWILGALILLCLGALIAVRVYYLPAVDELNTTKETLREAEDQIALLKDDITLLQVDIDELSGLDTENEALENKLSLANLHVQMLSILTDVYAAQYALSLDDAANAQVQLNATQEKLDSLKSMLAANQAGTVDSLSDRFELVLKGLSDGDIFAAQSDLEVLTNGIIQLENSFFANP